MATTLSEHAKPHVTHPDGPLENFKAPPAAGTLGTWLFVAGLAVAFTWLLIGYALTRSRTPVPGLTIPVWFWFSTFVLLVSSVCLHWAYLSAKMRHVTVAARALILSTALGWVFVLLQAPGLVQLIQMHRQAGGTDAASSAAPYMLILFLVALHGLHTLVGLGRMTTLNRRIHHDHSETNGAAHLKQMCLFWHFMAIVWVVMFGVILWT